MSLKRLVQTLLGRLFYAPVIPDGKTCGFSLVRSERANTSLGQQTHVVPPFYLNDVVLGDYSYMAANAHAAHVTIGKCCSIGPNFCCGMGMHPTNGISTAPMFYSKACQNGISLCTDNKLDEQPHTTIDNDVFIGANVTVLDGVHISNGAVIGAGAVVVHDIPPYAVAVGVPAKVVKYRFDGKTCQRLQESQWWNGNMEELEKVENYFWEVEKDLDEVVEK